MLKIKDTVALEELEKFGFMVCDNGQNSYWCVGCIELGLYIAIYENKKIEICEESSGELEPLDILYDLIQAGLVEKVEE